MAARSAAGGSNFYDCGDRDVQLSGDFELPDNAVAASRSHLTVQ